MSDNRYYNKKTYKGDFSAIATGLVFAFVGILSLIFMRLNIQFIGLAYWGYWLFIPAFFIIIGGLGDMYNDRRMRDAVYAATLNRKGRIKVEDLAQEVGIKPQNMLRILVDLRIKRGVQYSYDGETGEIIFGEEVKYEKAPEFTEPISKKQAEVIFPGGEVNYCPYCGHSATPNMQFCESCGSKLG